MTGLTVEGRAVTIVYLDFGKTVSTVSRRILIDMWMKCGLNKWTVEWTENSRHASRMSANW